MEQKVVGGASWTNTFNQDVNQEAGKLLCSMLMAYAKLLCSELSANISMLTRQFEDVIFAMFVIFSLGC